MNKTTEQTDSNLPTPQSEINTEPQVNLLQKKKWLWYVFGTVVSTGIVAIGWLLTRTNSTITPGNISTDVPNQVTSDSSQTNKTPTTFSYANITFGQTDFIVELELPDSWKIEEAKQDQNTYSSSLVESGQTVGELRLSYFLPALGSKNITTSTETNDYGSHSFLSFEATTVNGFGNVVTNGTAYAIKAGTTSEPDFVIIISNNLDSTIVKHLLESVKLWSDPAIISAVDTDTSGWSTYTNSGNDFSFKYPSTWRKENSSGEGLVQLYNAPAPDAGRSLLPEETKLVVYIEDNATFDSLSSGIEEEATESSTADIVISGKQAKKYVLTYESGNKITLVDIQLQENRFLRFVYYSNNESLDSILATLTF